MAKRFILALVLSALAFVPIAQSTGPRFLPVGDQPSDYLTEVAKGNVGGETYIAKFGENMDIDGAFEVIWDGGGDYDPPTSASIRETVVFPEAMPPVTPMTIVVLLRIAD